MSVQIKTIGDFKDPSCPENDHCFFVPSYQRGYRWTEDEVTALLDDVKEFSTEGGKKYCIQPLIVKRRSDGKWEVVDGQQRLTTIYIFMKIAEEKTEYKPFDLEYKTRKNSQQFLSNLSANGDINNDNIDYFHITTARKTINEWLGKQKNRYIAINDLFRKFIESVFFIWHEIPSGSDSIAMFTKVNLGKIPLTNAELIKALLLNKENFQEGEADKHQIEISLAWDRIEQGLHDESFWYFLNENEQGGTRIDMLFEALAECDHKNEWGKVSKQKYPSFLVFYKLFKDNKKEKACEFVKKTWEDVEKIYAELRDWYSNLNKYHLIGYLITSGMKISELINLTRGKRKSDVWKILLERVKNGKIMDERYLSEIVYGKDNAQIRRLLLLFNLATLVNKSEKQHRFPFDIYKRDAWDIEHIHATADSSGEADDSLANLTLLNRDINRAYKDKPFNEKRQEIIKYEKNGKFVPLCTKNVFLKVYSKTIISMEEWKDSDKDDYISEMAETLQTFFNQAN